MTPHLDITLDRKQATDALAATVAVVERRTTIPILTHALLEADADTNSLTIAATDLDRRASATLPADVTAPGADAGWAATTVSATQLAAIVKSAGGETVRLRTTDTGDALAISSGRSRWLLPTLPAADFPPGFTRDGETVAINLPAARLRAVIEATIWSASTEETRYYLNGVCIDPSGEVPHAVATNGHHLAACGFAEFPADFKPEGGPSSLIIPTGALRAMLSLAPTSGSVTLTVGPRSVALAATDGALGLSFESKLIDGTFPDWGRVVPAPDAWQHRLTVDREALAAALARLAALGRAGKKDPPTVVVGVEGETLTLATRAGEGEAADAVDLIDQTHSNGPPTAEPLAGFNGDYLRDLAAHMKAPRLVLEIGDSGAPMRITAEDADGKPIPDLVSVLMPVRLAPGASRLAKLDERA